jgi:hypothetical protein
MFSVSAMLAVLTRPDNPRAADIRYRVRDWLAITLAVLRTWFLGRLIINR